MDLPGVTVPPDRWVTTGRRGVGRGLVRVCTGKQGGSVVMIVVVNMVDIYLIPQLLF